MKYIALLTLACFLLAPAAALAEMTEKSGVQVDLPQDWTMKDSQGGNNLLGSSNIMLVTPDGEGQIVLSIFNVNATGAESLALGMSQSLEGSTPEAADGGYRFTFRVQGVDRQGKPFTTDGRSFVSGSGPMLGSLTCMGGDASMSAVLQSLRGSTPEVEQVLQSLRPGYGFLAR